MSLLRNRYLIQNRSSRPRSQKTAWWSTNGSNSFVSSRTK
jgi:hypothetical protein